MLLSRGYTVYSAMINLTYIVVGPKNKLLVSANIPYKYRVIRLAELFVYFPLSVDIVFMKRKMSHRRKLTNTEEMFFIVGRTNRFSHVNGKQELFTSSEAFLESCQWDVYEVTGHIYFLHLLYSVLSLNLV